MRDVALDWLKSNVDVHISLFAIDIVYYMFTNQRCVPSLNLSMSGFNFIQLIFFHINQDKTSEDNFVILNTDLTGVDYLWKIVLDTEQDEVRNFLSQL